MFYWFAEADPGSTPGETPILLWLNGGPGASSLTGLLLENIGPITIGLDGKLSRNPHSWTRAYNVIAFDNPVGAGYSYTKPGGYVTSEEAMRREYYAGLKGFLALHPEYRTNPIWVCGESYGGKYVPNVAYEIHLLNSSKYQVVMYNGVRDGSVCNHMGNLASMRQLQWKGQQAFKDASNEPWLQNGTLAGYTRGTGRLTYVTILLHRPPGADRPTADNVRYRAALCRWCWSDGGCRGGRGHCLKVSPG